jgi:hypothetical protein
VAELVAVDGAHVLDVGASRVVALDDARSDARLADESLAAPVLTWQMEDVFSSAHGVHQHGAGDGVVDGEVFGWLWKDGVVVD